MAVFLLASLWNKLSQLQASTVQARSNRADRASHDVGDLLVRALFDVGQEYHGALICRQMRKRLLDGSRELTFVERCDWVVL